MGRNGGNSWLDVVKKALRSPTKHTKTLKARMREEEEVDQYNKKSSKRRWIFKKTAPPHETTTILHDESNTLSTSETSAPKPITSTTYSDEKHAMAVEVTTTPSFSFQKHNAALVIQTSFRRYLARRALEALKGVVKLQALVRGHNVRRRTKMTLKCMQALLRVQAGVCDQRIKLLNSDEFEGRFWGSHHNSINTRVEESSISTDEWDPHTSRIEEIQAILQKTQVANGNDDHAFWHQIWRSGQNEYGGDTLEDDMSRRFYDKLEQRVKTFQINTPQRSSLSPISSENQQQQQQQRFRPSHSFQSHSPFTPSPSSLSRIKASMKVDSTSPRCQRDGNPSYMSATVSAMARIRPQSAQRQRERISLSTTDQEGEKKTCTSARKRLSFNVSEKYNSDSELDCNMRNQGVPTMEGRRLSMSSCCKERIDGDISRPSVTEDRRWFR